MPIRPSVSLFAKTKLKYNFDANTISQNFKKSAFPQTNQPSEEKHQIILTNEHKHCPSNKQLIKNQKSLPYISVAHFNNLKVIRILTDVP